MVEKPIAVLNNHVIQQTAGETVCDLGKPKYGGMTTQSNQLKRKNIILQIADSGKAKKYISIAQYGNLLITAYTIPLIEIIIQEEITADYDLEGIKKETKNHYWKCQQNY